MAMVLSLVSEWGVVPHIPGGVQIAAADDYQLTRAHAGQLLQLNHRSNGRAHMVEYRVDECVRNGEHWRRFVGITASTAQPGKRLQPVIHTRRYHLVRDGPFERPLDSIDMLVNRVAAQFGSN